MENNGTKLSREEFDNIFNKAYANKMDIYTINPNYVVISTGDAELTLAYSNYSQLLDIISLFIHTQVYINDNYDNILLVLDDGDIHLKEFVFNKRKMIQEDKTIFIVNDIEKWDIIQDYLIKFDYSEINNKQLKMKKPIFKK